MNGTKLKLLIFINTLQSGGAERVVSLLLNHLKDDFEIHLALYTGILDYTVPAEVRILDLKQPLLQNKILLFLKLPVLSFKLYRYCKKNRINNSVAFLYRPCYINAMMKTIWGYHGHVIMCEGTHQTTLQQGHSAIYRMFSKFMVKYAYQQADLILANSYGIKTDLIENFKIKTPVRVIYNPVDLHFIRTCAAVEPDFVFEKDIFHFITVGNLRREKNHLLLIQAFFVLKNLPCKLLIVGAGVMGTVLKQKVKDLGLQDKVVFCGFDVNPFKYVSRSDCFVLSSDVEGFPNVLIEALACGKAVISTDCSSGPRELLAPATDLHHRTITTLETGEYGILTPVRDVISLAQAMKKVFEEEALRNQFAAKASDRAGQFDVDETKKYFHTAFTGL